MIKWLHKWSVFYKLFSQTFLSTAAEKIKTLAPKKILKNENNGCFYESLSQRTDYNSIFFNIHNALTFFTSYPKQNSLFLNEKALFIL